MVSIEDAVIARITKANEHFEILVDPVLALDFRKGKPVSIDNVLAAREVFKDARKGERASENELQDAFGTTDRLKIAENIIKNGDIQLTTEQRRKMADEKRKQIADMISKQGVDPKTRAPHPPQRILNAMEQAHADIDPFKPAAEQISSVLEKIRPIIPISIETMEVAVRIPIEFAGKANSMLRKMFALKKEEWKQDAWICVVEIPAGMQNELFDKVNSITSGKAEVKILDKGR